MTENTTATFEDIRQAANEILDAAIGANKAAQAVRDQAVKLQSRKVAFEEVWQQQMSSALTEEGTTPKAKGVLHGIIDNLAAAEELNLTTTAIAKEAIEAVSRSGTKARMEEATKDVAIIAINERIPG